MAACRRWAVWVSRVLYVDHNARAVTKQVVRRRVHFTRASPTQAQLGWGFCFSSLPNPTPHVQDPALMLTLNRNRCTRFTYNLVLRLESKRSEEHTSELQSLRHLVCRLLLEK